MEHELGQGDGATWGQGDKAIGTKNDSDSESDSDTSCDFAESESVSYAEGAIYHPNRVFESFRFSLSAFLLQRFLIF